MNANASSWKDPLVQRLVRRHRGKAPELIVREYAARCLTEAGQVEFPVDVEGIASLLGIKRRLVEGPFAGRIYVEPSGQLVMDLRASDGGPRRRFSCAHEIIHTLFPGFARETRYRVDVSIGNHRRERYEEEYLCDYGAAELLMPQQLLNHPDFELGVRGLDAIEDLAAQAQVSLEAAGNRLARLNAGTIFLVMEQMHKPSELPALARGDDVPEKLRLSYATCADDMDLFLPRYKSALDDSPMAQALSTGLPRRGVSTIPGGGSRPYRVEARSYPRQQGERRVERVLAVAADPTVAEPIG